MKEKMEETDKPRCDLIDITHFTEKVSSKLHDLPVILNKSSQRRPPHF